jgi:hypothetical protein
MKLKTYYDAKYYLKWANKLNFRIQGMHQTNVKFSEEYLIPDATLMMVFLGP